jgi:hypothetical protein
VSDPKGGLVVDPECEIFWVRRAGERKEQRFYEPDEGEEG